MSDETIKLKQQHFNSYKKSILDIVENNCNLLVNDDIASLIKKPPLNSMDKIKNKFLSVAKKNELVVDSEKLEEVLNKYRNNILSESDNIIKSRFSYYSKIINKFKLDDTIKILKKDINSYNKKMKKNLKDLISNSIDKNISKNIINIINGLSDKDVKEIHKYLNNMYIKDILENIDIKILVKDATMINSIKEATDTYLFTLNNSRLFD